MKLEENLNKILAIVVTYNRKELLRESIEALLNQTYKDFDILIVDNNSSDGTYNEVVKNYENLKYLNTGSNIGGAGGFNLGVKYAIENGYDYAWLMDDDSIADSTALESVVKKSKKISKGFSFISSLVKWTDNNFCWMNRVTFKNDEILNNYNMIDDRLLAIESATFVGCFINLNISRKIGLPIKEFFIYADDVEYTLRLSNEVSGYIDFDSIIVHKMKNNVKSEIQSVDEDRIDRYFYDFRNNVYIYLKSKKLKGFVSSLIRYFKYVFLILKYAKSKKLKRIWIITKGTFLGLLFNPKIEHIENV